MRPNAAQLDLLRTKPHRTKLYLGIYKPTTVLACQVANASIAKGARSIAYDTVTAGNYVLVQSGMTMYVGSTPGAHDRGRIRVKSATSVIITVAENSHIQWADNLYLTVVSFYEPWGIYQYIELVSNIPIYYKDYDIVYSDQNQYFRPVVNMGPNHAGFIQTGSMGVFYTSSGTYDPTDDSIPSGYEWWFEGGIPTGSLVAHPGLVQYPNPGHFTTRLTVTSNQGKTRIGHRHIMAFQKPGEGANTPIINWGLDSIEGSRDSFGYSANFWLREAADFATVVEDALVVVFAEHFYNATKGLIGGNAAGREGVLFVGYIEGESIRYDSYTSALKFKASSITQIMSTKQTFSVALNDVVSATPQYWYEMTNITCDRAIVHYLQWHSTILDITDFAPTGDSRKLEFVDFGRGSLLDAVNSLYSSALQAQITADRQGKLWAEKDFNVIATGSRPNRISMDLTRADWLDEADILVNEYPPVGYVEAGGIVYDPSAPSGTIFAYLSGAPGTAPGYEGTVEKVTGLLIDDQADVNLMAGLLLARSQMHYPEVTLRMAGAYSNFDIAPQEFSRITLQSTDTWRRLIWSNKRFIIQAINWEIDPESESIVPTLTLKEETWGPRGDTIIIPTEPPYTDDDLPNWDITFPPIMPLPPIFPPINPEPPEKEVVYLYQDIGSSLAIYRCDDIEALVPVWVKLTIAAPPAGTMYGAWQNIYNPVGQSYIITQYDSGVAATDGPYIYLASGLQSLTVTLTEIWGAAQNQGLILNGSVARGPAFAIQSPTLGYIIGMMQKADIGNPLSFFYGQVGGWLANNLGSQNTGFSGPGNLGHLGGTTILEAGGLIGRSDNLGVSAGGWSTKWSNGRSAFNMVSDGINVIWVSDFDGTLYKMWHHDGGLVPVANAYNDAVDIRPSYGGDLYHPLMHSAGGWHNYKSLINRGDGKLYMVGQQQGGAPGNITWWRKNSFLQTSADWTLVYNFGDAWKMIGVDVNLVNPDHVIANHFKAATVGHIYYTANGGISWIDKTSNLAALGWTSNQPSSLKFAMSSMAIMS